MSTFKNSKPVIAIDGTAGSGKGTLAKNLSKKLNFDHLDTGLLYRIYAYESNQSKIVKKVFNIDIYNFLNDKTKLNKLRSEEISKIASQISKIREVRKSLVEFQRNFANNPPYDKHSPDFRVPFFTLVEFISYMGWIKVDQPNNQW